MQLSIIIVNYNVEFYLEQCLLSVQKAIQGIDAEVWVVDNHSVDFSVRMLQKKFPWVQLIKNDVNLGFSVANNQAIRQAKGKYVLLLNPDTIVEEDTFSKVLDYMDENPQVGGLGVKMVDGKGNFLAESKRGLPTPSVAFYKIFGLAKLFPKSKLFGKYHLGYLNENEIHEVDVLAGAFMLMPRSVLNKTGLLDERFFMYGEDIDLSYRITRAGYKNVYFPKTTIIHFKGESTKKGSANYVFIFYKAMQLFAQKHFSSSHAGLFRLLIYFAIYARAFSALLYRFFRKTYLPFIDLVALAVGTYLIQDYWERTYLAVDAYPWYYLYYVIPAYLLIWMISLWLSGSYDKPFTFGKSMKGIGFGTLFILVVYALLPEWLRFSRAIIIFSTIGGMFSLSLVRFFFGLIGIKAFSQQSNAEKRIAIVGNIQEARRVAELLRNSSLSPGFIGLISTRPTDMIEEGMLGSKEELEELITIYGISELVFCSDNIEASEIIRLIMRLNNAHVSFKIAPHESSAVIGSQSILQAGNMYFIDIDGILKPNNKRAKRMFDIVMAFFLFIFSPVFLWFVKQKGYFYVNVFYVLVGKRSWVGYDGASFYPQDKLPAIKSGVLYPRDAFPDKEISKEISARLNLMYAQDYKLKNDFQIVRKGFSMLGRKN